jgi:hypothetical protein
MKMTKKKGYINITHFCQKELPRAQKYIDYFVILF